MPKRLAVLASGGGSNLGAILDYCRSLGEATPLLPALVISDRAGSGALNRAASAGVDAALLLDHRDGRELLSLLEANSIDMIALAGYLKLVPPEVIEAYSGRIINVHPALLPRFGGPGMYGIRVHKAVIESGASISGVTVHLATDKYDEGSIIAQWPVPVLPGDDAKTLAARVLRVEHILFPRVLCGMANGSIQSGLGAAPIIFGDAGARQTSASAAEEQEKLLHDVEQWLAAGTVSASGEN